MAIAKETLAFLRDLRENNNREWFEANRSRYELAWQNMKDFVGELIIALSKVDPYIHADIPVSKCVFRIYRDTRFSKDKTPYKEWLGAGISTAGRKLAGPEYYLHISPGQSFIAGGYWRPEKEHLAAIRQEIDYNEQEFRDIVEETTFLKELKMDTEDTLKKAPAGYQPDHPAIDLLRLKSFTASSPLSDADISSKEAIERIVGKGAAMLDFKMFLHRAIGQEA
ncbi:DUF2461 domain-containing protein [Olivibacter sitiensis]|uniref:DUF2461 domain-containing protein n=1 Tax=Olivibacter sitiensis TaxID=376470 RepID=UPI000417ABD7|nr:DUF2461 domain-containing protein [Olivibacter sitiensis]